MKHPEYKFSNLQELHDMIKDLGYDVDSKEFIRENVVNITGTPFESVWGAGEITYGSPPTKFVVLGFGPDRNTPWGSLPGKILLLRKDIADQLVVKDSEKPKPKTAADKLYPPGWKPRPGYTDPREPEHYWEKQK